MTPLERAYELIERGIPPEDWPDAEVNAYCDAHTAHLDGLTDEQLDALIACPEGEVAALYYSMTGRELPGDQADSEYVRRARTRLQ